MAPEIFAPVIGTVQEFINWSLTIVSLMIIWYVVKFFMVAPPTEEEKKKSKEEWEEQGAKMREYFGGKMKEKEEKEKAAKKQKEEKLEESQKLKKKKEKKEKVLPVNQKLIDTLETAEDIAMHLSKGERKLANKKIKELNEHLDDARGLLRLLRKKNPDDKDKLTAVIEEVHAAQVSFSEELEKLPKKFSSDKNEWKGEVSEAVASIKNFRASIGTILEKLEKFHK